MYKYIIQTKLNLRKRDDYHQIQKSSMVRKKSLKIPKGVIRICNSKERQWLVHS